MSGSDSAPHRPRWAVFLGPSLPRDQARGILDARYLPPARRGDIWDILSPDLPGIILLDGVFHGQPAIWPREILDALAGGIPVIVNIYSLLKSSLFKC
ncbi:MAG TPA: hypothetical protein VK966_01960 [Longimicrobiales bacterium]|nr:hypothetical protein [Longimicrobiales bacterium]